MKSDFKRHFPLEEAYTFLFNKGLEHEKDEIAYSTDKYKSYRSTIKRAKIIVLVKQKGLLVEFCQSIWPDGLTKKGEQRLKFLEKLIERAKASQEDGTEVDEEEASDEETAFAYELDLQNYILKNLSKIEKGLKLYDKDGVTGEQFPISGTGRKIDILAEDINNVPVVIELKVSRGHERVIGQLLYYQSMIKSIFKTNKVRGIIIAKELSDELKAACQYLDEIELFEYQLSFTLGKYNKDGK